MSSAHAGFLRIELNASFPRFVYHRIPSIGVAITLLKFRKAKIAAVYLNTHGDEKIKLLKEIRGAARRDRRAAYSG